MVYGLGVCICVCFFVFVFLGGGWVGVGVNAVRQRLASVARSKMMRMNAIPGLLCLAPKKPELCRGRQGPLHTLHTECE